MDKTWMVLSDAELSEYVPTSGATKAAFYRDTDTSALLLWAATQIRANRITKLYLLAHGFSASSKGNLMGMSLPGDYSLPEKIGGEGIIMGDTPICIDNDYLFRALGGCGLKAIVLPSCSIVNGDGSGGWGDGRTMCQHIANYTGATLYASDTMQTIGQDWQGNLYQFKPNQSSGGRLLTKPYPAVAQRIDG